MYLTDSLTLVIKWEMIAVPLMTTKLIIGAQHLTWKYLGTRDEELWWWAADIGLRR
jgi:hypothetical protein